MTSVEPQMGHADSPGLSPSANAAPWWSRSNGPMFWLICLLPTLPMALVHWLGLLGDLTYAFLPLPFLLVAFLYWQRADGSVNRPRSAASWSVVGFGLIAVLIGALIGFPWFGTLGFVLIGAGALVNVRGVIQRSLVGLIAPLLAIALPLALTDVFANWINLNTAWLSSIFLDYFEIPHSVSGSVIRLFESEVVTSQICGGVISFPFFLFLAFAMIAWKRMSLWLLPAYAIAAIITTLAVNSLKLVTSVIATESMEMDLTEGWYPMAMSLIAGLLGFGVLYSFHHLFAIAFHHVEPNTDAGTNPFVQFWNKFSWMNENRASEEFSRSNKRELDTGVADDLAMPVWYGLIGTAAVLSLLSLVGAFRGGSDEGQTAATTGPLFTTTETFFADVEPNDAFQISSYSSSADGASTTTSPQQSALRNDTWTGSFRDGNLTLQVTQPVPGWIEITRGYKRSGWEIIDRNNDSMELVVNNRNSGQGRAKANDDQSSEDAAESPEEFNAFATARMRSGDGTNLEGYLYYSAVGSDGSIMKTPTSLSSMWQSIRRRLGMGNTADTQPAAMIQILVVTPEKLSPGDIRLLKREFLKRRNAIAEAILSAQQPGTQS